LATEGNIGLEAPLGPPPMPAPDGDGSSSPQEKAPAAASRPADASGIDRAKIADVQLPMGSTESAEGQLTAAIRRLIREEMGQTQATEKPPSSPTTWREGLTVVALICIVLFSSHWILLDRWFTKDQIDFAKTLGTFLGGGLVFARPDWMRNHILGLAERKRNLEVLLAVLAIVLFARFATFKFQLTADPSWAQVYADKQYVPNGGTSQALGIDNHVFEVRGIRPEKQKNRLISMTGSSMVFRLLTGRISFKWPLLMQVELNYPAADEYTVEVTRTDAPFDDDFRRRISEYQTDTQVIAPETIVFSSPVKTDSGVIWLPYGGTYNLTLREKTNRSRIWQKCGLGVNDQFVAASDEDQQVSFEDRYCKP
jgi:hypothetical protein